MHLEPDVLPERVVPGAGDDDLHPVRRHGQDRADVRIVELGVLVLGAHGLGGVHRLDLGAGQPADEVEVVHVHVAEDAAAAAR